MSKLVRIADLGDLAEKELDRIGRACEGLAGKLERIMLRVGADHPITPRLQAIHKTTRKMSLARETYLALAGIADQAVLEAVSCLDILEGGGDGDGAPADSHPPGEPEEEAVAAPPSKTLTCHSEILSISEVIGLINFAKKSGTFQVFCPQETLIVVFRDGDVIGAYSDNPPEGSRLGEILVARGTISSEELNEFLQRYLRNPDKLIGEALREEGLIDHEKLREALEYQIQELFYRLFRIEQAEYSFSPQASGIPYEGLSLNVTHLLLESARCSDWSAHTCAST